MTRRLTLLTASAILALCNLVSLHARPATDLGKVMCTGDSITHGINSASWRWELFKILTDNGIAFEEVGIATGNHSGGVAPGTTYRSRRFANVHAAVASERAYEIAGRRNASGRFANTGIRDWLGLNPASEGKPSLPPGKTPDLILLLIGTNDLLSEGGDMDAKTAALPGDMQAILDAIREAGPKTHTAVLSVPCWTRHANNNDPEIHAAVAAYNAKLKTWAARQPRVTFIDVNPGLIDPSSPIPFYGVESMFNKPGSDGLHPNAQGDLIIAGHVARALGYPGRTAGLPRKASTDLPSVKGGDLNGRGTSRLLYQCDTRHGITVDFTPVLGDGAQNGRQKDEHLSVIVGGGILKISKSAIQWGDRVLYAADLSHNAEAVRIARVAGDPQQGIASGYYVWLGDMLIGEALEAADRGGDGSVIFSYRGDGRARLGRIAIAPGKSFAPAR